MTDTSMVRTPRTSLRGMDTVAKSWRWGVILAGGEGSRLRSLTRSICGDERPKQFCKLLGETTPLEQTCLRAAESIRPAQTLFAVTRAHEKFYLPYLGHAPGHRIVQPFDKGTAPAILYSLLRIARMDPDATVAVLPCDHYSDDDAFAGALDLAFELARVRSQSVVLLGAQPRTPELDCGLIDLGAALSERAFLVRGLHEKRPPSIAGGLVSRGALWNTSVMVGHVEAFLQIARAAVPGLLEVFHSEVAEVYEDDETRIPDALYDWVHHLDFSQILSASLDRLVTLKLKNLEWHHLAYPDRVLSALLSQSAELPVRAQRWIARSKPEDVARVPVPTILLVEDDPDIRALTKGALEKAGYSVVTADDGEAGLHVYQEHRPRIRLLLTDVKMPRLNGIDLADRVLQFDSQLPVLFMSGDSTADRGFGCLAKPFRSAELVACVNRALNASEQRKKERVA